MDYRYGSHTVYNRCQPRHCAVLAYNTVRWMAQLSGNKTLCEWEPETLRTYLIKVAGKLLTGNISQNACRSALK
jgi:hypothetical protein